MHGHSHGIAGDAEMRTAEGITTAKWSSFGLLVTGLIEMGVFFVSGSAGLLADAFHNLGDISTTLAVWVAFVVSRRQANERYPHGYHRVEDLAGLFVLAVMAVSAFGAGYTSIDRMITGERPTHLTLSAIAAFVGFAGNELVAQYKARTGRRIGSVSLVADAAHSRTDGLVSLAALAGIIGVAAGFDRADGLAGLLITLVIIAVLVSTARGVLGRALDEVDPALTRRVQEVATAVPGVAGVHDVRLRWAGRALFVTLSVSLPPDLPLAEAHESAEAVRHALLHEIENLREIDIHMDPEGHGDPAHALTAHHRDASGSFDGSSSETHAGAHPHDGDPHQDATHGDHAEHEDHDDHGHDHASERVRTPIRRDEGHH